VKKVELIEDLVAVAPKIEGWQFTATKPPAKSRDSMEITMSNYKFNADKLWFYAEASDDFPDKIALTVVYDDFNENDKKVITNACFILLDNYLGELNFLTTIDYLKVAGKDQAQNECIPISKLDDYLRWRQKEFVEKYEGERHDTENDQYGAFEATLNDGKPLMAVMNTTLMEWDRKASHPWIAILQIKYEGNDSGMSDEETYQLLNTIEDDEVMPELRDVDGYLNLGRQTANNVREVFFACKDFRQPSRVFEVIRKKNIGRFEITCDVYKDKYWKTFSGFMN
jgi:hypothetical protein